MFKEKKCFEFKEKNEWDISIIKSPTNHYFILDYQTNFNMPNLR
jgi:hypothetical protein